MGPEEIVVTKQHPSAFTGTGLASHLERLGKRRIVLAGMYAACFVAMIERSVSTYSLTYSFIPSHHSG